MRWVRPIFTTSAKAVLFAASVRSRARREGITRVSTISVAAIDIAVGNTSFEDCERFT